jgi:hypothetical protein
MNALPKEIEFSTLPKLDYTSEISIAGDEAKKWIEFFKKELEKKGIKSQAPVGAARERRKAQGHQ